MRVCHRGSIEVSRVADISDTMDNSQMGEPSYVLTVKLLGNIRVPAFSELEVLAQVKCDGSRCYVLENNFINSDLLVARVVVMPGDLVPVCPLNPTGGSTNLHSGASVAVLSEVMEVTDSHSEDCGTEEAAVTVSAVYGKGGCETRC